MNSDEREVVRILNRMGEVRAGLQQHVGTVYEQTKELADWRTHVRRHPWMVATGAALIAWLLIPRRRAAAVTRLPAVDRSEADEPRLLIGSAQVEPIRSSLLGDLARAAAVTVARQVAVSVAAMIVASLVTAWPRRDAKSEADERPEGEVDEPAERHATEWTASDRQGSARTSAGEGT